MEILVHSKDAQPSIEITQQHSTGNENCNPYYHTAVTVKTGAEEITIKIFSDSGATTPFIDLRYKEA